jgi:dephospho-CoA kinase
VDFDLIARKVVEPGEPALQDIVEYFGKQVLQEDGTLDRKKVSAIVFRDMEKRKKLEGFIHPRMGEEVIRQVNGFAGGDPNAIIQMVVPLMIEINLQYQCHKLLVVYVPEEKQIERLMARDSITREQAAAMLKAQLPIDEKLGYADFVIRNDGSLEETRKQVEELWRKLRQIQGER